MDPLEFLLILLDIYLFLHRLMMRNYRIDKEKGIIVYLQNLVNYVKKIINKLLPGTRTDEYELSHLVLYLPWWHDEPQVEAPNSGPVPASVRVQACYAHLYPDRWIPGAQRQEESSSQWYSTRAIVRPASYARVVANFHQPEGVARGNLTILPGKLGALAPWGATDVCARAGESSARRREQVRSRRARSVYISPPRAKIFQGDRRGFVNEGPIYHFFTKEVRPVADIGRLRRSRWHRKYGHRLLGHTEQSFLPDKGEVNIFQGG